MSKIRYSAQYANDNIGFRLLEFDIRSSNVKIEFQMSKCGIRPEFEYQNRISNDKCDIRPEFECQNRTSNV